MQVRSLTWGVCLPHAIRTARRALQQSTRVARLTLPGPQGVSSPPNPVDLSPHPSLHLHSSSPPSSPQGSFACSGLVHLSELSWDRVSRVEDVTAVGQTVEVKVIGIDT